MGIQAAVRRIRSDRLMRAAHALSSRLGRSLRRHRTMVFALACVWTLGGTLSARIRSEHHPPVDDESYMEEPVEWILMIPILRIVTPVLIVAGIVLIVMGLVGVLT